MTDSLLTPEDRKWLQTQATAVRRSMAFMLSSMFRPDAYQTVELANSMLVWHQGAYHQVEHLLRDIESKISSMVWEQFELWRWEVVMGVANKMNALDAKALILASGFAGADVSALHAAADEAVNEAREALYGLDEEHC